MGSPSRPGRRATRRAGRSVVATARALEAEGLVVGTVGNVSARVGPALLITPTRAPYARMRPRDLARVEVDASPGTRAGGAATPGGTTHEAGAREARAPGAGSPGATPSRELPLHLAVYRARPDVGAVVHTHSVAATAWSFLDEPLGPELEDLAYHGIDPVRTAAPAVPGSAELATGAVAALGTGSAVLLGRHGLLTTGDTPERALLVARVVEHQARVGWVLRGAAPWAVVDPGPAFAAADEVAPR